MKNDLRRRLAELEARIDAEPEVIGARYLNALWLKDAAARAGMVRILHTGEYVALEAFWQCYPQGRLVEITYDDEFSRLRTTGELDMEALYRDHVTANESDGPSASK